MRWPRETLYTYRTIISKHRSTSSVSNISRRRFRQPPGRTGSRIFVEDLPILPGHCSWELPGYYADIVHIGDSGAKWFHGPHPSFSVENRRMAYTCPYRESSGTDRRLFLVCFPFPTPMLSPLSSMVWSETGLTRFSCKRETSGVRTRLSSIITSDGTLGKLDRKFR